MSDQPKRVIIVTGGAGGLGRAIVRGLVAQGHRVAVMDIDRKAAEAFVTELKRESNAADVLAIGGDISQEADCKAAVGAVLRHFGRVDGLVNNAGLGMSMFRPDHMQNPVKLEEVTPELWHKMFSVNATGTFLMTRTVMPHLQRNGWGRIISVTTSFFTMLNRGFLPYGPSKAAIEASSAGWAAEFKDAGITVNVVVPGGPADTPMVPNESGFDRALLIRPEAMCGPINWLVSEAGNQVTGQRFVAGNWNFGQPAEEAAKNCGTPIGWPELAATTRVWPGDAKNRVKR